MYTHTHTHTHTLENIKSYQKLKVTSGSFFSTYPSLTHTYTKTFIAQKNLFLHRTTIMRHL